MRGKDSFNALLVCVVGITPARAGKRWTRSPVSTSSRDHPRACGEKPGFPGFPPFLQGSPPRVRGKVQAVDTSSFINGITPARAGKRYNGKRKLQRRWDHPRACGEKRYRFPVQRHPRGSPPRVRGKDGRLLGAHGAFGITPARAGKRNRSKPGRHRPQDHPRACGEKPEHKLPAAAAKGSPPRVRGKDALRLGAPGPQGITPARAGKSYRLRSWPNTVQDHPRACGEKVINLIQHCQHLGSPPRVRGKDYVIEQRQDYVGITPARAGKSLVCRLPLCMPWDHPRACGEKSVVLNTLEHRLGSPPRVRGKELNR